VTDSTFPRASKVSRRFVVERALDAAALAEELRPDRLFAAYALAQLEPEAFALSTWWTSESEEGCSVVAHSRGGLGETTFVLGPAAGVRAILSIHPGPYQTFVTAKPEHVEALGSVYGVGSARPMVRMQVTRDRFQRVAGASVLLHGAQVRAINRLYGSEGTMTTYLSRHIDEGLYRGVVVDGRLVSVAGTHAVSAAYGIAVVGNVYTHPDYRGRGYATVATSAVTETLLERCGDVVLSVSEDNEPALQAYQQLGYAETGAIVEAAARRRIGSLSTGWRRTVAAFRGRRQGVEVVRLGGG
jgi:ribosomal protein S18 acetylase RimI-like enzyme